MTNGFRWPGDALCRVEGHPQWWDLEVDGEDKWERAERWAAAQAVCDRCPVRAECAAAFDPELDAGVWAGEVHNGMTNRPPVHAPAPTRRRTA